VKTSLQRFRSLDSTNSKARELLLQGADEGTIIVAESQTAGRGRGDRTWHSPSGGLYYSILLRPIEDRPVTDLSFLGGIAVAQTLKELLPKSREVSVKWPNDCLLDRKKVAGILGEAVTAEPGAVAILGIGINVNTPATELVPYQGNPFSATSVLVETGGELDVERVIAILTRKLVGLADLYHQEGFVTVQALWERLCTFIGKKLQMGPGSGYRVPGNPPRVATDTAPFTGNCLGIDEAGALVLSTPEGERRHYVAGEMTCFW
jgi:BirA family biotin operon repressor/biotin-[acetyl-CoA-carboxylase] ligase